MHYALMILLILATCDNPLNEAKRAFASGIHADAPDDCTVSLHDGAPATQS